MLNQTTIVGTGLYIKLKFLYFQYQNQDETYALNKETRGEMGLLGFLTQSYERIYFLVLGAYNSFTDLLMNSDRAEPLRRLAWSRARSITWPISGWVLA